MAVIQSPLAGKISGSSGNVIFQSYNGKVIMRSFPSVYHYPDTFRQQIFKDKKRFIRLAFKYMNDNYIQLWFKNIYRYSRFNEFFMTNYKQFDFDFVNDKWFFGQFNFLYGPIGKCAMLPYYYADINRYSLRWNNSFGDSVSKENDLLVIVYVNKFNWEIDSYFSQVQRKDGEFFYVNNLVDSISSYWFFTFFVNESITSSSECIISFTFDFD